MARRSTYIAGALVLGLAGWMASGMLAGGPGAPAPETATRAEPEPVLVETVLSRAAPVERSVLVQGDARAFRSVGVRSEASGRIARILVEEGQRVEAGDPIAELALDERSSRLAEAKARLAQRQQDYDAGAALQEKGYATDERIRELRADLEEARAEVAAIEQDIADTTVPAPFGGIVDRLQHRVGEVVAAGDEIATLVDNAPLRVEVRIPQQDIARIDRGSPAEVSYATGAREAGRVCVVSVSADAATRTFRVELRTPNADREIPSGISAEVRIPTGQTEAHFLTPAILSLNDDGQLGVKTVTEEGTVAFDPVTIVQARADGIWVSGLPAEAQVITTGQGFVRAGEPVRVAAKVEADVAAATADAMPSPAAKAGEAEKAEAAPAGVEPQAPPGPAICEDEARAGGGEPQAAAAAVATQ